MNGNILEYITEQYHSLTRSGKKLADYIFTNTSTAQYLSISTLAENSGVSEALPTPNTTAAAIPLFAAADCNFPTLFRN